MKKMIAPITALSPRVTLKCGRLQVSGIVAIPNYDLVAVSAFCKKVYVFENSTQGEPIRVFDGHRSDVRSMVHLSDDIIASVDDDGMLLTWRATTGHILEQFKVSEGECWSITKASSTEVLIGTGNGEILLLAHGDAENFDVLKRHIDGLYQNITGIDVYNDVFVALGELNVQIWSKRNGQLLYSIEDENFLNVSVSEDLILLGGEDCKIYVYQNGDNFTLLRTIDLRKFHPSQLDDTWIADMSFLDDDVVMVTAGHAGIFFVSPLSGQCLCVCPLENSVKAAVLNDGHLFVGGMHGYCAMFEPPEEVECFITQYNQRMQGGLERISDSDQGSVVVDAMVEILEDISNGPTRQLEMAEEGISRLSAEEIEARCISYIWKKIEMIEQQNEEQDRQIEKMKVQNADQEDKMAKLELRNKLQEEQNKQYEEEIQDLKLENKEQAVKLAQVALSNIRQEGKMKLKIEKIEMQYKTQEEQIGNLELRSNEQ